MADPQKKTPSNPQSTSTSSQPSGVTHLIHVATLVLEPSLGLAPSAHAFPGSLVCDHLGDTESELQISARLLKEAEALLAKSADIKKSLLELEDKPSPETVEDLALKQSLRNELTKVNQDLDSAKYFNISKITDILYEIVWKERDGTKAAGTTASTIFFNNSQLAIQFMELGRNKHQRVNVRLDIGKDGSSSGPTLLTQNEIPDCLDDRNKRGGGELNTVEDVGEDLDGPFLDEATDGARHRKGWVLGAVNIDGTD
ncbi:hypothetical protein HDU76_009128 [Blyttiomyces sp. JEL0837]|nr:hypothetical protein HDU76_009128 [Blyttiomyces sp. JEL0837]